MGMRMIDTDDFPQGKIAGERVGLRLDGCWRHREKPKQAISHRRRVEPSTPTLIKMNYGSWMHIPGQWFGIHVREISEAALLNHRDQNNAMQFGGELTPPGMLNGLEVMKNVHRFSSLQIFANSSRSNISPIGIPQPASRYSCNTGSGFDGGNTSQATESPATAAKPSFQIQRKTSSVASTPVCCIFAGFSA